MTYLASITIVARKAVDMTRFFARRFMTRFGLEDKQEYMKDKLEIYWRKFHSSVLGLTTHISIIN